MASRTAKPAPRGLGLSGLAARLEGRAAEALFVAVGAASLMAYGVFWLRPLWLARFDVFHGEALSVVDAMGLNWSGLSVFVAGFLLPTLLYVCGLLMLPRIRLRTAWRVAIAVAVAAPLLLLYTYPGLAADVFDYLMIGRLLSAHGLNPYTHSAISAPFDPYYPPVGWKLLPSVYGPVWVLFAGMVTAVCGSSTLAALLLMKLAAIAAHWAVAAMVYLIARRLDPKRALFAFVAYAWNPLAIVHFAVDGHNDAVLLLFLLAAVYFALDRRWELSFVSLMLSALVKFVPLVLFPLFLWHARRDKSAALTGLWMSAALAVVLFWPFWAGVSTFDGVRDQASRMTSSPASVASYLIPDAWLRPIALAVFGAGYLIVLRKRLGIVQGSYAVLLLYLTVLSFWTKPWYFTWPVALGAIVGGATFWTSIAGMLGLFTADIFGGWGWRMDWLRWYERWGQKAIEIPLTSATIGGWVLGWAAVVAWRWPRGRRGLRPAGSGALARSAR